MVKQFECINDFFYYVCNLDSENHLIPSLKDTYIMLRELTSNFDYDACKGAMVDLRRFREEIKPIQKLDCIYSKCKFEGNALCNNNRAILNLYISNAGILSAELDLTRMSGAEHLSPLVLLIYTAINRRLKNASFERLDDVEKKLQEEIERHNRESLQKEQNITLEIFKRQLELDHMKVNRINRLFDILIEKQYIIWSDGSFRCNPKKMSTTQLAYVLKKIYSKNESVPWLKWQEFLNVNRLAGAYEQIKKGSRDWYPEFDEIVKEASKSK